MEKTYKRAITIKDEENFLRKELGFSETTIDIMKKVSYGNK